MSESSANHRRVCCDDKGVPLPGYIDDRRGFHVRRHAQDQDIDELGHVKNATWVSSVQDASVAHWLMAARPEDRERYAAVVVRHEVDYRSNVRAGDEIDILTWVDKAPRVARYSRRMEFADVDGKPLVSVHSQRTLIGKLARVPEDVAMPFQLKKSPFD